MLEGIFHFLVSPRGGLLFNLIGTICVAFSFGKNRGEAHQFDEKGRKEYLASFLYPRLFTAGIVLIIAGFFLQLIS